jgi:hypothetical protein
MKLRNDRKPVLIFLGLFGLVLCHSATLNAKERPAPPQGPLIQSASEFCNWLEEFSYHPPDGQPDKAPDRHFIKSISNTKTKDIIFTTYSYFSGNQSAKWQINMNVFLKPQGQLYWAFYEPESIPKTVSNSKDSTQLSSQELDALLRAAKDPETLPMPENGFDGLEWVNSSAFAGNAKENGRELLLFVHPLLNFTKYGKIAEVRLMSQYAIVDATTRLPAEDRAKGYTRKFTFLPPPTTVLSLPPDLVKENDEGLKQKDKARAMPPRGY